MKKKLLTSAAIASFLTAAGIVIPQADIFAADTPNTPNTPHPSTLENTPHPSTVPTEQPSANTNSTENIGVKEWSKLYDKKKVDSFADYWIESITRDKNYLTIKTKDNAEVYHAAYMDEENIKEQADNYLIPEKVASNIYRFNTDKLVRGEGENKKFSLSGIDLGDSTYNTNGYIFNKFRDINGNITESPAYTPVVELNAKDLYKYADVTRVVGSKATVESEPRLPEVGDKDYVVYTDKSQVELNGTIKTTVKYKPGVKKYSDILNEKYVGKTADGRRGFENIFSTTEHFTITDDKDEQEGSFVGWYLMDKNGNDVFYSSLKGFNPGHYNITRLFGLDITKGNFDNADFTIAASGKSIYRTDKVEEQPKVDDPKAEQPKSEVKPEQPKVDEPKAEQPRPVTNSVGIAEKFIETLSGEVTSDGKLVYTFKSKEPLSYNDHIRTSLTLFNDKTGNSTTHITLYTNDGKNFTGDYAVKNLENGVWKPYEISFTDSNGMPKIIERKDLIPYDKQSQVFIGVTKEEPIGSPQLQGKKIGVFANYKKVNKGTVVKYTIKTNDKELKDDSILLVRNGDTYFDHNASRFTLEYDSNGNRVIYVRTENLEPGIYNVISIDGKDKTKLEDIYTEDGWFEVGNEDVRREGPAVWDTVPTTKPSETPKSGESPKPGKEETLKPGETSKPGKEETLKPGETSKPGKEETLKPSEMSKPGKKETPKPDGTPKPSETSKPGKEETLKPSEIPKGDKKETTKYEKDNSWNPFAKGQKAKEGSTEVKSEGGEAAVKSVSNRKEGKALPNTGLQITSYGFLAAVVGLFGAVALRRKNR